MTKKKIFAIIFGSIIGILLIGCVGFVCYFNYQNTKFSNAGICISSTNNFDVIWCQNEKDYSYYLGKFLYTEKNKSTEEDIEEGIGILLEKTMLSKKKFTSEDYQTVQELYNYINIVIDPVTDGIYLFYSKENDSFMIINLEYDKKLKKKLGNCMQAISVEKCWIVPELSL